MISIFGSSRTKLRRGHNVATVDKYPTNLVESGVPHGEMNGIVSDDVHYEKRYININGFNTINRHLTYQLEANHGMREETQIISKNVKRKVDYFNLKKIRNVTQARKIVGWYIE